MNTLTQQYFTNEIKELKKKIKMATELGYPSLQDEMNLQDMIEEYNSIYKK
jgi:hypothetical protein